MSSTTVRVDEPRSRPAAVENSLTRSAPENAGGSRLTGPAASSPVSMTASIIGGMYGAAVAESALTVPSMVSAGLRVVPAIAATVAAGYTSVDAYEQWSAGRETATEALARVGKVGAKTYGCAAVGAVAGASTGIFAVLTGPLVAIGCIALVDKADQVIGDWFTDR